MVVTETEILAVSSRHMGCVNTKYTPPRRNAERLKRKKEQHAPKPIITTHSSNKHVDVLEDKEIRDNTSSKVEAVATNDDKSHELANVLYQFGRLDTRSDPMIEQLPINPFFQI